MNISIRNTLSSSRQARSWSQQELADASGISRAEVSAIETGRLAPSTATALRLAKTLAMSVEQLFTLAEVEREAGWAWEPKVDVGRFWEAQVGARLLRYPVEPTAVGELPHDGTFRRGHVESAVWGDPDRTLVVAGCDPAVGLLAAELARREGVRLIALTRGSSEALELLRRGLVHAAGIHWGEGAVKDANAKMVRERLGAGYGLLHLARWQEGIAVATSVRARTISSITKARLRWVAREKGSGARHCLDRLLGTKSRKRFRYVAYDHREVALAIRSGFAQAGVAVRLAAEEAGLDFVVIQREDYELCYSEELRGDPALALLRKTMQQATLKRLFQDLPGYDVRNMGEERSVARVT
ncbi:MAG: helix-turn-helix domain-containing protein [Acidobacteria bacterium]|nr:MAG: helix-turn-helix domain-containing protein [Acidobacteriota bacterium]